MDLSALLEHGLCGLLTALLILQAAWQRKDRIEVAKAHQTAADNLAKAHQADMSAQREKSNVQSEQLLKLIAQLTVNENRSDS